jgi:carbamoyltransferase
LFHNQELVFGIEEERLTRQKHAVNTFPSRSIQACLDHEGIELADVDQVLIPWAPEKFVYRLGANLEEAFEYPRTAVGKLERTGFGLKEAVGTWVRGKESISNELAKIGTPTPEVKTRDHHQCHAASAFHPSPFDQALVLTLDGYGEHVSTAVWTGTADGLKRVRSYDYPNSLGFFFGAVTQFLGFRPNNGEGKVMGLAPYGKYNADINQRLRRGVDASSDYDLTSLVTGTFEYSTRELERRFGRARKAEPTEFTQWEKDLAFTSQRLLEEIVTNITARYCAESGLSNVALAGGVALNCKMNKRVLELDCVDRLFVQPVAHDAGSALGAGMLEWRPDQIPEMNTVYWGHSYTNEEVTDELDRNKLTYSQPDDLERFVAERLADGALVGWYQGRLEMGPRALGNRSILADPRDRSSLDRVNEFVKHREAWRPFAPSILESAIDEYLVNGERAPYMIKTFDVDEEKKSEIPAVLHPSDGTTRPQTVSPDQNPRYHELISEFADITGVPVVLNTSFNDNGEPIINRPAEAIKAFFGMGLDLLVMNDVVVEK